MRRALCFFILALTGCAHVDVPILTDLSGRTDCVAQPDLSGARVVQLDKSEAAKALFDLSATCWQSPSGKSLYAVFVLPESEMPYVVSVASLSRGNNLVAPRLRILDAAGNASREIDRTPFLFHGNSLQSSLRVRPGERYVIVSSDPLPVGQEVKLINDSTMATTSYASGFYFTVYSGQTATTALTYAHAGNIEVAAQSLPKAK